ncbi:DNA polymerase IV, partial [Streptomyces sp. SID8455]|nr:DNA polymerase IV [Streptomyces sp. SID8455]
AQAADARELAARSEAPEKPAADGGERGGGPADEEPARDSAEQLAARRWPAGHDVRHAEHGHGWVQGSGVGRVTVRFEEPGGPVGRVVTFRIDDPELSPADPLPLVRDPVDYSSWPASLPKSRSGPLSAAGGESRP